jgi:RNA polymerase sigma factor (sigma-70 family)
MPIHPLSKLVERLRAAVRVPDGAEYTDARLLGSFIERRDEAAFAALVHRHGPMVWNVCRRILRDHHNTEDAFQATFLVLVRKAASVNPKEMVGNWLYGVAYQTALKARALLAKRKAREKQVLELPEPAMMNQDANPDWQVLLDRELSRLPAKYRVAIVLCDLEGRTRKEASQQVGVPEGTLAARLARGRTMLVNRLARHGLAFTAGSLVTVLTQDAAACVPVSVVTSTIQLAGLCAARQALAGLVSADVAAFTKGVLTAMLLSKVKTMVAALVLVTAGIGVGVWVYAAQMGERVTVQATDKHLKDAAVKNKEGGSPAAKDPKKTSEPKNEVHEDRIEPGDRLFVEVSGTTPESPIKGVFRVEAEGTIALGAIYGRVSVHGETLRAAEGVIQGHLGKVLRDPQVMVTRYDPLAGSGTGVGQDAAAERRLLRVEEEVRQLRIAVEKLQRKK